MSPSRPGPTIPHQAGERTPAPKSCLLIIPRHFYSFEKHIREALEARGYRVDVSNDEYPEGLFGRIVGKLQIPFIFPVTYRTITRRFLENRSYDLALIFKGRGISGRLIETMRRSVTRIVGYNWDSFRLNRAPLNWYKLATRYYTFDYRDADRWSLPVVELFSSSAAVTDEKQVRYQLSAILRNHSSRLGYVDRVVSILRPASVFISIYEPDVFRFIINFLKSPRLYFKYRRQVSFRPLTYGEYSDVLRSSEFTVDYAHHTQTGITMRCFEAVNMKTKIITNNPYIRRGNHFHEADYVVFGEDDPAGVLVDACESCRRQPYASIPRTISDFIAELVAE